MKEENNLLPQGYEAIPFVKEHNIDKENVV
jgi:hypothetical protein